MVSYHRIGRLWEYHQFQNWEITLTHLITDPVSLLSILSKLLERHFVNLLLDYIQARSPLSPLQWGFTSGKSATSALLHAVDIWHKFLEEGTDICTVFFDYRKAFDSIPHRALIIKLKAFRINEYIVNWLISYLCDRNQYVCVNGSKFWPPFSNIWCSAGISTRSNPLHYLCEWNKQCLPHCCNYVTFCRWHYAVLPYLLYNWLFAISDWYWWHMFMDQQQLAWI